MPLNAIDPTWINQLQVDAEELRRDMGFLLAGGATPDVSRSGVLDPRALTVTLSGSNVQINPGGAAVGTGKGAYLTGASVTATVDALTAADVTNPRRDRVVLEILDPDNGGGAGRNAQFRVITGTPSATAASGGGYPAAPSSPSITLAYVDVPKSGNGSPSVTDQRPFTAAAGAPIPVRDAADQATVTHVNGRQVVRLDLPTRPVFTSNGTAWAERTSGALSMASSYQPYGGGYEAPAYVKDQARRVTLSGMVGITTPISMNAGTPYLLATLPGAAAIAPAGPKIFPVATGPSMGYVGDLYVYANGDVKFMPAVTFTGLAASNFYVSLEGVGWWV